MMEEDETKLCSRQIGGFRYEDPPEYCDNEVTGPGENYCPDCLWLMDEYFVNEPDYFMDEFD